MQLPTFLIESLKSGRITISENNVDQMNIRVSEKKIDVDVTDKKLIKEVITSVRKGSTSGGVRKGLRKGVKNIRAAEESRPLIKDIVEDLCKEGVTVVVSYKGDRTVTIGKEANSKLTRLVTGTKGIQVDSPLKLAEMTL